MSSAYQVTHARGDLFSCPPHASLAHCISSDCVMGAGIAVAFRQNFGRVDEIRAQKQQPGGLAPLRVNGGRWVYNMVTKSMYFHKPSLTAITSSLILMRSHAEANGVTEICMPRIGSGLDRQLWSDVEARICAVFSGSPVRITVYTL